MNLTRNLEIGMSGEDVRAVKDKLFELGFYDAEVKKITHDRFGNNTKDAVLAFQKTKNLEVDGIVGNETWTALFVKEKRVLKYLMSGEDVRYVKNKLFALDFYSANISQITNDRYGKDTVDAVKRFQSQYHLNVDGIVGKNTWKMLEDVLTENVVEADEYATAKENPRIGQKALAAINKGLQIVSEDRRKIVLEALKHATDASIASQFEYPSSLYIRGGNLYNKDLTINTITEKYLNGSYYKKYKSYCTSGRLDMMIKAVRFFLGIDIKITGADCSGGIVGLLRFFGYVEEDFDDTANGLCGGHSIVIEKVALIAGDFVGRDGHICLYVGGGYLVEWVGGEFGCQLTNMNDHKAWSFTKKKYVKQKTCKKYRRPKFYK